jgi:hypothetical protein
VKISSVFGSLVGTRNLPVKVDPPKKKPQSKKNSTKTVEFFFDCGFFSGCTFTGKFLLTKSVKATVVLNLVSPSVAGRGRGVVFFYLDLWRFVIY